MQKTLFVGTRILFGILFSLAPFLAHAATLSLSPASGTYTVGDIITVSILIDTEGAAIDGVDLHYLRYNPAYLELSDADDTRAGVQIAAGSLMTNTPQNMVDTTTGAIDFSQLTSGGVKFTSNSVETLATMKFKVKGSGSSSLTFDVAPGKSDDTNIVSSVRELLTSATGASFTLSTPSTNNGSGSGSSGGGGGSSSSSGGGGGGGGGISIPPQPSGFSALGGPDQVLLRWTNPVSSNFVRTRIIRKENSQPVSANDGTVVFEGDTQTYTDTNVTPGVTYYYAIFSLDTALRASALSVSKATVGEFSEQQIITKVSSETAIKKQTSLTGATFSYRFTAALQEGFTHEDVRFLQKFLNSLGFVIASSGSGSPGNETTFFGALTKNALARFQAQYIPSIVVGDRGLVGPSTRAKLNELASKSIIIAPAPAISATGGSYVFARNLTVGSRGEDVRQLQKFLNANGFVIASAGDGSPGNETDFFGNLTKAAIIRFQDSYASEILAPATLTKGSGFFGQLSRNKIHQLMKQKMPSSQQPTLVNTSSLQEQINAAKKEVERLLQQLQQVQ